MRIVSVIAWCAVVGFILYYGQFLINWAEEDKTQQRNQKTLMRMHQQEKKLQEVNKFGISD